MLLAAWLSLIRGVHLEVVPQYWGTQLTEAADEDADEAKDPGRHPQAPPSWETDSLAAADVV
jgi:hypothetical protein